MLPVKFNALNQLPVATVCSELPLVIDKLGALVVEPPVVPNVYVLVMAASETNPPVPVQVKPVAVAALSTVVSAVVCANIILFEPNATLRVFELLELNRPKVLSDPPKSNVPAFSKHLDVAVYVCVASSVKVTSTAPTPIPPSCLLNCGVHVCVLVNTGMKPV